MYEYFYLYRYNVLMKELNGADVAEFIKERQIREVRSLIQSHQVLPKLAIICTNDNPATELYIRLKKAYGADVQVAVDEHRCTEKEALTLIKELNDDNLVHGIIVQLPLSDVNLTQELVDSVAAGKDVDGLGVKTQFTPATPQAILWLLAAYNTDLLAGPIAVIGQGRLVGAPLVKLLESSGCTVVPIDEHTPDPGAITKESSVIITAVGKPGVLTGAMVSPGTTVIDAGVATDSSGFVGDATDDVREIKDIRMTPKRGGVGPLTIAALFENVITAAKATVRSAA